MTSCSEGFRKTPSFKSARTERTCANLGKYPSTERFCWGDRLADGLKKSNSPKEPFVCPDRFRDFSDPIL